MGFSNSDRDERHHAKPKQLLQDGRFVESQQEILHRNQRDGLRALRFGITTAAVLIETTLTPTFSVTLTIATTAPSPAVGSAKRPTTRGWPGSGQIAIVLAVGICILGIGTRRCYPSAIVASLTLAVLIYVVGCGGGGSGGGGGGGGSSGTPPGNYTGITVTVAISGVTQSIISLSDYVQ
jgi:hypothetical protein